MLEPERYELEGGPSYRFEPDRREFFGWLGGGLLILLALDNGADAQESGKGAGGGSRNAAPRDIGAWLHIAEDGSVNVFTGKTEVGQNIRTSLTQAVAEELHTPIESIRLVMADTDLTPFDAGTFGSRTTPTMAPQLRQAAIAAREMLLDLASEKWKAERQSLFIEDGRIRNRRTGEAIGFGDLTKGKRLSATVSAGPVTTPTGVSVPKIDAREMVTGRHRYTSDMKRPGMLYGRVLRPPALQSSLVSADLRAAENTLGVVTVRDGSFLGAAATDRRVLDQALAAIKTEWQTKPQQSGRELYSYLKSNVVEDNSRGGREKGSIANGLEQADAKLEATYNVAYIAHVPLEPRAAVAEWLDGKLTVWTGTQRPFGVRSELAEAFGIPEERIRVIVPDTGSGYGGKHSGEAAIEAARLAKAAGKPVKLVWTREEEFQWAYHRPAGVIDIQSGVRKDGALTAWAFDNYNSGSSGIETPYEVASKRIQYHRTESPMRQGSYRGLAATANHFARESHMDELAHTIGMEPLAFRWKNLKDARMQAVLEAGAERFRWGKAKAGNGHGFGISAGFEKGGYVACCAEVSITPQNKVKIERVVMAFECGAIVNLEHLRNQVEGGTIMGIGGALFEAIEFEGGRIKNSKLSHYRVPRFSDVPMIDTVLVNRKDLPSAGAGESPIVGIAPAVGNAIFSATGKRVRNLPMTL